MTSSPSSLSLRDPLTSPLPASLRLRAQRLGEAGIKTLGDILWVFPLEIIPVPRPSSFESLGPREGLFRGIGRLLHCRRAPSFSGRSARGGHLWQVTAQVRDAYSRGTLQLKWFNAYGSVSHKLSSSEYLVFTGSVRLYGNTLQVVNPRIETIREEDIPALGPPGEIGELNVRYPTVNSVPGAVVKKIIDRIPDSCWDTIGDPLPASLRTKRNFPSLGESFRILHGRWPHWSREGEARARERVVYQEFFEEQLKLSLRRKRTSLLHGVPVSVTDGQLKEWKSLFPYCLTPGQEEALTSIRRDLAQGPPMMRLLQGDVGHGKTTVALLAILMVCGAGHQCALMCPTESLAYQHFLKLGELLGPTPLRPVLLLGSTPAAQRRVLEAELATGQAGLAIGTHALIQKSVVFHNLALALIDEQHKFGVDQRLSLVGKGRGCHCLIMTATPIPRSLRLTEYGDLDVGLIKSVPRGRRGFKTRVVTEENFRAFLSFVKTRLSMGEQGHLVVPAIEESESLELESVASALREYSRYFAGLRLRALHGRMPSLEKQAIFRDFTHHKVDLLVSTSVVEVGLDVPNATVMAILNPERFGLCSLHQLRGRVGRGKKPGFCFLVTGPQTGSKALERCRMLESCHDGFRLAEEDLKLRGQGDILGTRQSGGKGQRRVADLLLHSRELLWAKEDMESLGDVHSLLEGTPGSEYILHTV